MVKGLRHAKTPKEASFLSRKQIKKQGRITLDAHSSPAGGDSPYMRVGNHYAALLEEEVPSPSPTPARPRVSEMAREMALVMEDAADAEMKAEQAAAELESVAEAAAEAVAAAAFEKAFAAAAEEKAKADAAAAEAAAAEAAAKAAAKPKRVSAATKPKKTMHETVQAALSEAKENVLGTPVARRTRGAARAISKTLKDVVAAVTPKLEKMKSNIDVVKSNMFDNIEAGKVNVFDGIEKCAGGGRPVRSSRLRAAN